jgi:predicted murein hydrolase (TIGR00659 family)
MKLIIDTPLFGIMISLLTFEFGSFIYKKTKLAVFNPLLISQVLIILFLIRFDISLEAYNKGGQMIAFLLGPATVILAVPLYKKMEVLKKNAVPIIGGITVGSMVGMVSVIILCSFFKLDSILIRSLIPKSVTVPIGIEISKQLGGLQSVTVAAVVITGILGSIIGPFVCKALGIKDKVAVGTAIGTASHAVGTIKAIELGETEGAMSGLSIGVAGLITVILAPVVVKLFSII